MLKYKLEDFNYDYRLYARYVVRNKALLDLRNKRRAALKANLRAVNFDRLYLNNGRKLVLNK